MTKFATYEDAFKIDFGHYLKWSYSHRGVNGKSCDVEQEEYGGRGYKYVLKYVTRHMKRKGMSDMDIEQIFIHNPSRIFPLHWRTLDGKENKL